MKTTALLLALAVPGVVAATGTATGAPPNPAAVAEAHAELTVLSRRARLIHRAITLSTSCALLICLVIVSLFAGVALGQDLSRLIVLLFTAALAAFVGGLLSFLLEIRAATGTLHFAPPKPQ